MLRSAKAALLVVVVLPLWSTATQAVNPAEWMIVEQVNRSDTTKTWTSPTSVNLGKMLWEYDFAITKVTATVNVPLLGDVTEDITNRIPADVRVGSGETRSLPAVLLDEMIVEPETGTSADLRIEIDNMGFGRAVFTDIMLGSVDVPLFGSRPIQRINLEASVNVIGFDFGDYNRNAAVDAADYVVWRDTLNQAGPGLAADGNGNEQVDLGDHQVWTANFGRIGASAAGASLNSHSVAVPEPATVSIVLAAMVSILLKKGGRMRWTPKTGRPDKV